jgi:hypothetical protein
VDHRQRQDRAGQIRLNYLRRMHFQGYFLSGDVPPPFDENYRPSSILRRNGDHLPNTTLRLVISEKDFGQLATRLSIVTHSGED